MEYWNDANTNVNTCHSILKYSFAQLFLAWVWVPARRKKSLETRRSRAAHNKANPQPERLRRRANEPIPSSSSDIDSASRLSGTLAQTVWFECIRGDTCRHVRASQEHALNYSTIVQCRKKLYGGGQSRVMWAYLRHLTCPGTHSWFLGRWFCVFPMHSVNMRGKVRQWVIRTVNEMLRNHMIICLVLCNLNLSNDNNKSP